MSETAKVTTLKGNPNSPESAEHIIIFPGGSISVCRTSNNEYWAHIEVNLKEVVPDTVRQSAIGQIVKTRIDYNRPPGDVKTIADVSDIKDLQHIAVKIKTS